MGVGKYIYLGALRPLNYLIGITNIDKEEETLLEKISILLKGWLCFDHELDAFYLFQVS